MYYTLMVKAEHMLFLGGGGKLRRIHGIQGKSKWKIRSIT